jgi:hypothetical protein
MIEGSVSLTNGSESGSGSLPLTNGPGSGSPKTYRSYGSRSGSTTLLEPDPFSTLFSKWFLEFVIRILFSIVTRCILFLPFKPRHFTFFLIQKTSRSMENITLAACSGFSKIKKGPEMNLLTLKVQHKLGSGDPLRYSLEKKVTVPLFL